MYTRVGRPLRARCQDLKDGKQRRLLRIGRARVPFDTCKTDLAGALIVILTEHMASASIQTGRRRIAGVSGRVLAVLACEPQGTLARGFPQHGLGHTRPTILAAVLLTGVSMLTIFSQEALWTSVWKRAESMKTL